MKSSHTIYFLILSLLVISGCATMANVKDTSDVYQSGIIEGASTILLVDLSDNRVDKTTIGQIGMMENFKTNIPINVALTDRIAMRLKTEKFNVKKVDSFEGKDVNKISDLIKANSGTILITGTLDNFFISSFDPVLDAVKGRATFYVKIFNTQGQLIFSKNYESTAEHWAGISSVTAFLSDKPGAEKTIEKCLQGCVETLFKDAEFKKALGLS